MARSRAYRRRRFVTIVVALAVLAAFGVLFTRDVFRSAHDVTTARQSEDTSFARMANDVVNRQNFFDSSLVTLLSTGSSMTRPLFAAQLSKLANEVSSWSTAGAQLIVTGADHQLALTMEQLLSERSVDFATLLGVVATKLALPFATPVDPTRTPQVAQQNLVATSRQWRSLQYSLVHGPRRVTLLAPSAASASIRLGSALANLVASPLLSVSRGVAITAVRVDPAPLPAVPGTLLLPPVTSIALGITVTNTAYVDQPVTLLITWTPIGVLGRPQHETLTGVVGPLRSLALVPRAISTLANESATLTIGVRGVATPIGMSRTRTYRVKVSG